MEIILGLSIWLLCGVLTVFISGVVDRITYNNVPEETPLNLFFIMGPLMLLPATLVLIYYKMENIKPLRVIYNLGYKNGKNNASE